MQLNLYKGFEMVRKAKEVTPIEHLTYTTDGKQTTSLLVFCTLRSNNTSVLCTVSGTPSNFSRTPAEIAKYSMRYGRGYLQNSAVFTSGEWISAHIGQKAGWA
jgi:hypothetical protein